MKVKRYENDACTRDQRISHEPPRVTSGQASSITRAFRVGLAQLYPRYMRVTITRHFSISRHFRISHAFEEWDISLAVYQSNQTYYAFLSDIFRGPKSLNLLRTTRSQIHWLASFLRGTRTRGRIRQLWISPHLLLPTTSACSGHRWHPLPTPPRWREEARQGQRIYVTPTLTVFPPGGWAR